MDDISPKTVRSRLLEGIPTTQQDGVWSNNGLLGHGDFSIPEPDLSGVVLESQANLPLGYVQPDAAGHIIAPIISLYGPAVEIDTTLLELGRVAYTTDTNEIRRGDGATLGGIFVVGHPRLYVRGSTTLTTTDLSNPNSTDTIPVKHGALYRIFGLFRGFNDTDNLSNFQLSITREIPLAWGSLDSPTTWDAFRPTGYISQIWGQTPAGSINATVTGLTSTTQTIAIVAPDFTRSQGYCSFEVVLGCRTTDGSTGGNILVKTSLRTAKIAASPACTYSYWVQRIK